MKYTQILGEFGGLQYQGGVQSPFTMSRLNLKLKKNVGNILVCST